MKGTVGNLTPDCSKSIKINDNNFMLNDLSSPQELFYIFINKTFIFSIISISYNRLPLGLPPKLIFMHYFHCIQEVPGVFNVVPHKVQKKRGTFHTERSIGTYSKISILRPPLGQSQRWSLIRGTLGVENEEKNNLNFAIKVFNRLDVIILDGPKSGISLYFTTRVAKNKKDIRHVQFN